MLTQPRVPRVEWENEEAAGSDADGGTGDAVDAVASPVQHEVGDESVVELRVEPRVEQVSQPARKRLRGARTPPLRESGQQSRVAAEDLAQSVAELLARLDAVDGAGKVPVLNLLSVKLDGMISLRATPVILRDSGLGKLLSRVIRASSADTGGKLDLGNRAFALRRKWKELCRAKTKI